ncbi:MAG TPA: hypothetical protein VGZ02_04865 [Candidatus Baltobacteraceae bacterium]|jgi:hypothetical protein|nr:hypothetical protein [Candidatus Baltobacteraceae bacterium]
MRALAAASLALALGAVLPAQAATNAGAFSAVQNMVSAYGGLQTVRVIEHFENGAMATVDVMPGGQYRVAETGGEDPSLIVKIATQPVDGAISTGTYDITPAGKKTIEGVPTNGYKIASPDGTYQETVWIDAKRDLPVTARVQTQGHTIDVEYGNYNATPMVATH